MGFKLNAFKMLVKDGLRIKKIPRTSDEDLQFLVSEALFEHGITKREIMLDTLYRYFKEGYLSLPDWEDYKKDVLLRPATGGELAIKK